MNDTRDIELNAIGVLKRREIEARLLAPLVEALGREFGRERVLQIVGETIVGIARDQGRQLVQVSGGNSLQQFTAVLPSWTKKMRWRSRCSSRARTNCASTSRGAAMPRCTNHSA